MAGKQMAKTGHAEDAAGRQIRKRTPSVEIELMRLKDLSGRTMLYERQKVTERLEEYISSDPDIKLTPISLVIAANAIVLEKEGEGKKKNGISYKKDIEKELPDSVNVAMKGIIVDISQLLENYGYEIKVLQSRYENRVKRIWSELPNMTSTVRKAAKYGASTVVSGTVWGAIYLLLKDYAGQVGATIAGAALASAAFYATSKKGAEFLSTIGQQIDYGITSLRKRIICSIYARKKVDKLLTLGKVLNQEMGTGEEQGKEDRKLIKSIGKTMPSPFEEEKQE